MTEERKAKIDQVQKRETASDKFYDFCLENGIERSAADGMWMVAFNSTCCKRLRI